MFVAAAIIGAAAYLLQRLVARALLTVISGPSTGAALGIQIVGLALLVFEAVAIYFLSGWLIRDVLFA